jgi:dUTP pyrophosphatase
MFRVKIKRFPHAEGLELPFYATPGSVGMDLLYAGYEEVVLKPFERRLLPTGIAIELPEGYEAQVRPRSGLAIKHGITILNAPGTIDSDYRGEIKVILINLGNEDFVIRRGDRIASWWLPRWSGCSGKRLRSLQRALEVPMALAPQGDR